MNRTAIVTTLAAGALGAGLVAGLPADASTASSSHKVSKQDVAFLKSNDQSNLAEVSLGHYIEAHTAKHRNVHKFAVRVGRDHSRVEKVNRAVAKEYGVTLPSSPSKAQQAAGKKVMAAKNTAYAYFTAEIDGHQKSIKVTKQEIAKGHNATVVRFAKAYLPIAQGHLKKAEQDLHYLETH